MNIHIESTKRPVFLITGIKVARGVSLESTKTRTKGLKVKLGFAPPGTPVEGGPETGAKKTVEDGLTFEGSSDFIIGVRVEKLKDGSTEGKLYTKGATMQDENVGGFIKRGNPDEEDLPPGFNIIPGREVDKEDDEDTAWIIPKL